MQKSGVSDDGSSLQQEHEKRAEVMLTTLPTTVRQLPLPAYVNASTGTAISSINGTVIVNVKADSYSFISSDANDSNENNNTTTISYEQLSRQFYQSYDPSIGLHTAAVLGGILVWLVIYVIYRTKVRKCIAHLVKKSLGQEEELDPTFSDSERDSSIGGHATMVRTLVNPSIVIDTSPPLSPLAYDQYNRPGEQECLSPFSIPRGINSEGVFRFPYPGHCGSQEYLNNYHQQTCQEQHEVFIQLPKSELDIPTATAQWIKTTPLEANSHQDYTSMMLSMQTHGLLSMHKSCSCPLVCSRSSHPLLLLETPNSWSNSLPALPSSSMSNHILSACDTVTNMHTSDKDIKDIINAKRKMNTDKHKKTTRDKGYHASATIAENNFLEKCQSNRRCSQVGTNYFSDHLERKKHNKIPPNLTIQMTDYKENHPLLGNSNFTRSPVPIPFTPNVMIHNAKTAPKYHQDSDSNSSISSTSSKDLLLTAIPVPHTTKSVSPNLPSPHLLSPAYEPRQRKLGHNAFNWNREDILRYHDEKGISESSNPIRYSIAHQQCSFKYQRKQHAGDKDFHTQSNEGIFCRYGSCCDNNFSNDVNKQCGLSSHRRSLSDYSYHEEFLLNSSSRHHNQRSTSAEMPISVNVQEDVNSPTCSKESNKNSVGTVSHSPTPYLLQVPDLGSVHRPMISDYGVSNKCHLSTYNSGSQPSMRHCVHSDSNIAYYTGECFPYTTNTDNCPVRRHSAFVPGEINLSFCGDNTVRPSSSCGSSGSYSSPHHHPHLPHRHSSHHNDHHDHHHRHNSTGMLGLEDNSSQHNISCISHPHSFMNRSFSAVVMETKL